MKQYVIADNIQTVTGMRLAGVDGTLIGEADDFSSTLNQAVSDNEIGIIMISPSLIKAHQQEVDLIRFNRSTPLIVEIEGPLEDPDQKTSIAETIQHAIGISL
ncbi:MAG: V-type ATP synthase subunit F [Aerococcus sp.]|nr:V-type ATP synthase subunit F [Aerococcus sp.]